MEDEVHIDLLSMTADLVSAYVSNNSVPAAEVPALLVQVHGALTSLSAPAPVEASTKAEKASPAQIRKSITPDALISFVDGKPYKTLRRHLTTNGLNFEEYRARYGLPSDYPSVSVNYSASRSALARELGLGNRRRKEEVSATPEPAPKPKRAARSRKATEPA